MTTKYVSAAMGTAAGIPLDLSNLDGYQPAITIEAIAGPLSLLPRFLGHTTRPFSVAGHCLAPIPLILHAHGTTAALAYLLHDAHEAFTGDLPSPLKNYLRRASVPPDVDPRCVKPRSGLDVLQDRLQAAILHSLNVDAHLLRAHADMVSQYDRAMVCCESNLLQATTEFTLEWTNRMATGFPLDLLRALTQSIETWVGAPRSPRAECDLFLSAFHRLRSYVNGSD